MRSELILNAFRVEVLDVMWMRTQEDSGNENERGALRSPCGLVETDLKMATREMMAMASQ